MFDDEFTAFADLLDDVAGMKSNWKQLSARAKLIFFEAMRPYPFQLVEAAMMAHIRDKDRGIYQPAPADVVFQIDSISGGDGRPGADEAWATALLSRDEADTVVWTQETAEAFAIASPVLGLGDEVGARVAFKEAYNRLCGASKALGKRVQWQVSLGFDATRREAALTRAANAGLLPAPVIQNLLPAPAGALPTDEVSTKNRERIAGMLAQLNEGQARRQAEREAALQAEREVVAEQKRRLNQQVSTYQGNVVPIKEQRA